MQAGKTYQWHKVAEHVAELPWGPNNLCEVEVAGKWLCLARVQEALYACARKCPHAGGSMSRGFIDPLGHVVCPLHRYRFNLQNGRNVSGEGYHLKTYPVELREDGVYVGLEAGGIFGWLR